MTLTETYIARMKSVQYVHISKVPPYFLTDKYMFEMQQSSLCQNSQPFSSLQFPNLLTGTQVETGPFYTPRAVITKCARVLSDAPILLRTITPDASLFTRVQWRQRGGDTIFTRARTRLFWKQMVFYMFELVRV